MSEVLRGFSSRFVWPRQAARIEWLTLRRSLNRTRKYASGILLDVGSCSKPYFDIFDDRVDRFLAVDLYDSARAGKRPDVFASVCRLPFKSGSIDTLLCTQVLEFIPDPMQAFAEFYRCLRPGGHLVCTTAFMWREMGVRETAGYHDCYRFTSSVLRYLGQRAGLTVVQQEARGGFWATIGEMASMYLCSMLGRGHIAANIMKGVVLPIQIVVLVLDRLLPGTGETLGWTTVFHKPASNGLPAAEA